MAPSREIEKLERRWQENPLGLTFAPLAEAYRKEGRFPDAIELLNIGLTQHPNYVPAHIVRGRCFLDTQADRAAAAAFTRVIEIDGENVIALKALADIAERAGRFDEARARLERLLEFDRNNEEAREQLVRVVAAVRMPKPGEVDLSKPPVEVEPDEAPPAILREPAEAARPAEPAEPNPSDRVDHVPVPASDAAATPEAIELGPISELPDPVTPSAADYASMFGAPSGAPRPDAPTSAEPLAGDGHEATEPADDALEIEVTPELDVAGTAPDPDEPEEPEESEPFAAVIDAADDRLEVVAFNPVELSAVEGTEYQLHDDAATLRPDEARGRGHLVEDIAPLPGAASETAEEIAAADPIEPAAAEAALPDDLPTEAEAAAPHEPPTDAAGALPDDVAGEAEAVLPDAALPDDVPAEVEDVLDAEPDAELVITESMAELFLNQGHRELALAVYTQLLTRDPDNERLIAAIDELRPSAAPAPAQGLPAYAAVLTGGQSVRGFFEQLLSARRPQPGRRTPDVSLGSVFGESGGGTGYPDPDPDAGDAGPTFDEFFAGDEAAPPPIAPGPESEEEAGAEDLENFTTWLKGLKR